MDAVRFLREKRRMCVNNACDEGCCPLFEYKCCCDVSTDHYEEIVAAVEQWAREHPIRTRQSELLKMFPLMKTDENGVITFCPMGFDRSCHEKNDRGWCTETNKDECTECKRKFWLAEIKDGET